MAFLLRNWLLCGIPTDDMELMVPWYVWPSPAYDELIAGSADLPVGRKSAVVVGGSAGPGPEKPFSQLHMDYWGKLRRAGWLLYGYVHCTRGQRPLADVIADVDTWVELYGEIIGGIFVDETPNKPDEALIAYLEAIVAACRKAGLRITLNPGTEMHDGGAVSSKVDVVIGFESSHAAWRALPLGFRCRSGAHGAAGAAVIHSFEPPPRGRRRRRIMNLMRAARARGFKVLFVTDAGMPDPYSRLPAFFRKEVACLVGGPGGAGGRDKSGTSLA